MRYHSVSGGVGREIGWAVINGMMLYEVFDGRVYPTHYKPTPILTVEETRATIARYRGVA